ncbi:MAG TPA: hypothetical protein VJ870_05815 [Amycolatopsis sp.]|nr:hypothetical protein [Amycolatopsis sp.]
MRLLEHHRIAAMRSGPGGGLSVTAPSSSATTNAVAYYLTYEQVRSNDLLDWLT